MGTFTDRTEHLRNCHLRALRRIEALCERCEFFDEFGCLLPRTKGRGYIAYHFTAGQTLDDVLSILDEHLGECVAEHSFSKTGFVHIYDGGGDEVTDIWRLVDVKRLGPGDRITIYRIRKEDRE